MFASIIAVRKIFSKMFCAYMEKYKIHTKHYISACVGVVNLIKERLKKGITLVVDIGSCSAEYCLLHKDMMIDMGLVNIGGFDMTRDIANVLKIHMQDAEKLKLADNEQVTSRKNTKKYHSTKFCSVAALRDIKTLFRWLKMPSTARLALLTVITSKPARLSEKKCLPTLPKRRTSKSSVRCRFTLIT